MNIRVEGSSSEESDGRWNRIAASSAKCKENKARWNFYQGQRPLGGLHRASPSPFRASYFTSGLHPPGAAAQRLTTYLYKRWSYRSSSFTHSIFALRSAHRSFPPVGPRLKSLYSSIARPSQ